MAKHEANNIISGFKDDVRFAFNEFIKEEAQKTGDEAVKSLNNTFSNIKKENIIEDTIRDFAEDISEDMARTIARYINLSKEEL